MIIILSVILFSVQMDDGHQNEPEAPPPDIKELYHPDYKIYIHNRQVCGDRPLRTPGGLGAIIATYCTGEFGEYELNTGHLLRDQYDSLISPMKDEVNNIAIDRGWRIQ